MTNTAKNNWNQTKWIKYVTEGLTSAAESIVHAGVRVHEFKTQAKCCKGGSEFSRIAEEKFGMSASMSSRWATIGENSDKLLVATKNLPNSMEAVYLISTLSSEQIQQGIEDGVINHEATQREIKQLKQSTAKPAPQEADNTPDDDAQWDEMVKRFGDEDLAMAVWDEVISETEATKIKAGEVSTATSIKRMAKKLYGDKDDPNMLPSQVAGILGMDTDAVCSALGIQAKKLQTEKDSAPKRQLFFEVTPDVVALESELENPTDVSAMCTESARQLYQRFKRIVELWSEIIEGETA